MMLRHNLLMGIAPYDRHLAGVKVERWRCHQNVSIKKAATDRCWDGFLSKSAEI
jgi:hypothetical protein